MLHFTRALFAVFVTFLLIGAPMTDANAQGAAAVHVVTYLDLAPESVAKAKPLLQLYRDASAKSSGSAGVDIFQEIGRPGRIVVRETWADQKAFEAQGKSAASSALTSGLKSFELAPPDQRVHLDFASGAGPAKAASGAVHVFTHVDVPPPRQGDLEPMLKSVQAASVKAATSIRFDVLQQSSRKNHFTVVETWSNRKALDAQALAPAQRDFRNKLGPMLGALYDQRLYRALK